MAKTQSHQILFRVHTSRVAPAITDFMKPFTGYRDPPVICKYIVP